MNSPPRQDLSFLLVEDSAPLVERLQEVLASAGGITLAGVVDGEAAAVQALAQHSVDVLLLDLHLRQGTGFGVLRALLKQTSRPTVIVFTNYDLAEYRQTATALGAEYFLDKARDMDMLPGIIDEIRAKHLD